VGNWGNGVWQDDVADDVILRFQELLEDGRTPREAVQGVLADPPWGWGDQDDDVVQVLAIAALAVQHGVLDPALRDRAIAMIESGDPLGRWTQSRPEKIAARQEVLDRFKGLLARGTATPEELASVTEPEAFSLW
jgi:hypothetical protein